MEKKNQYIILEKYFRGDASPDEIEQLKDWFVEEGNADSLEETFRKRWQELTDSSLPRTIQERMWSTIHAQVGHKETNKKQEFFLSKKQKINLSAWAAVFMGILSIGITSWLFYTVRDRDQLPDQLYTVISEKGQKASVILPDGTSVWLNSDTKLSYAPDYGKHNRTVYLDGEAYFEVTKQEKKRFKVKTSDMEVEALGTAFNVKAYKEDSRITTTLFEGTVRTKTKRESVILYPDHFIVFNRENGKISSSKSIQPEMARMWRKNELAFNSETLGDIARLLNRLYNVEIHLENEEIAHYSFSGTIRSHSLENILEVISLSVPISYKYQNDSIIINNK